ncbi:MAG: hypothetical protein NZ938_07635 [Aigarchaeota archaeon]|nr:hypothetical protein [Candidatus Calditenuaceae archaeon]
MSGTGVPDLIKLGVKIGANLKADNVEAAQVNKLLELLNSEEDERTAVALVAIFAHRQANRGYMRQGSAREISMAMRQILAMGDGNKLKENARRVLGTAKWVYESLGRVKQPPDRIRGISDIPELLKLLEG